MRRGNRKAPGSAAGSRERLQRPGKDARPRPRGTGTAEGEEARVPPVRRLLSGRPLALQPRTRVEEGLFSRNLGSCQS